MQSVTQDLPLSPLGSHTRIASIDTAQSVAVPAGARRLFLTVESQNARITFDGSTTATATVGLLFPAADETKIIDVVEGMTLSIIGVASGGSVNYQFSR